MSATIPRFSACWQKLHLCTSIHSHSIASSVRCAVLISSLRVYGCRYKPNLGAFAPCQSLGAFSKFDATPEDGEAARLRAEAEEKAIKAIIKEDCHARGSRIADECNVPDDSGRVMVNFNHPEDEDPIYLTDHLAKQIKPHQIGGE